MMKARERCELLRNLYESIAETNGIKYVSQPCFHDGWCPGYCSEWTRDAIKFMRIIEQKEASGSPIKIDVESLKILFDMARFTRIEPVDDLDDEEESEIDSIPHNAFSTIVLPNKTYSEEMKPEGLKENVDKVCLLCQGCRRYKTIQVKDGKAIRCSGLSENFFSDAVKKGHCHIKTSEE